MHLHLLLLGLKSCLTGTNHKATKSCELEYVRIEQQSHDMDHPKQPPASGLVLLYVCISEKISAILSAMFSSNSMMFIRI